MAATIERTQEYETHNRQFCSRVSEYLQIMFKFQVRLFGYASGKAMLTFGGSSARWP